MNSFISLVYPSTLHPIWPQCETLLKEPLEYCKTHNTEDVRKRLLSGQAQLWVQWNSQRKRVEACTVTEFVDYPRGCWLRVWLGAAATDTKMMKEQFQKEILNFAKLNFCAGIENIGRAGWLKTHQLIGEIDNESCVYRHFLRDEGE